MDSKDLGNIYSVKRYLLEHFIMEKHFHFIEGAITGDGKLHLRGAVKSRLVVLEAHTGSGSPDSNTSSSQWNLIVPQLI